MCNFHCRCRQVIIVCLVFVYSQFIFGQVSISFVKGKHYFNTDNNLINLEVKLESKSEIPDDASYNVIVFSDCDSCKKALYGISSTDGKIGVLDAKNTKITIILPIDASKLSSTQNDITFRLEPLTQNSEIQIVNQFHTVILQKPIELSLELKKKKISYNKISADEVSIPFIISSTGRPLSESDKVKVELSLMGYPKEVVLSKKEYIVSGNSFSGEFLLDPIYVPDTTLSKNKMRKEDDNQIIALKDSLLKFDSWYIKMEKLSSSEELTTNVKINPEKQKRQLTFNHSYNKSTLSGNTYNFFIGTNFDFEEQISANSFYSEIDVFLPDLTSKEDSKNKFGLRAGIYKSSSVSSQLEERRNQTVSVLVPDESTDEIFVYERKRVETTPNVSISNIGLYSQILYTLRNSPRNNFRFRWMIGFHFEIIERTETYSYSNEDLFSLGFETISPEDLEGNETLINELTQGREFTNRFFDSYYGVALPLIYESDFMEVFICPVFGLGNAGNKERLALNDSQVTQAFGIAQFYLVEKKYGIKLSGEARKYFASGQNPIITINISKSINLSGIFTPNSSKQ